MADSPELQAFVREQHGALGAIRAAAVFAPSELRARLSDAPPGVRSTHHRPLAPALAAVCVLAVAVAVVVSTIGSAAPTVAQAAQLASRPATAATPAGSGGAVLAGLRVAGLPFPYWEDRFGWLASGVRRDSLSGRTTTTVFYRGAGRSIGYTIVPGPALATPANARVTVRDGTRIAILRIGSRTVVTWLRRGHSCVLSGSGMPSDALVRLAAFRSHGAIPY